MEDNSIIFLVTVDIKKEFLLTKGMYMENGTTINDMLKELSSYSAEPFYCVSYLMNDKEDQMTNLDVKLRHRHRFVMKVKSQSGRKKTVIFNVYKKNRSADDYSLRVKSLLYGSRFYRNKK